MKKDVEKTKSKEVDAQPEATKNMATNEEEIK
jgi:hypothetical protein